ncbi:succinate dehydrogenase assembly factor 3, mitochondrial-like [Tubulanus polymorphus]|uniref:succinate dehydrogenase assembly factor 3, mitochondrial-like n=1 Tax=Tubulanus polymorphus TaxID=672921 RepID=UPI003DA60C77
MKMSTVSKARFRQVRQLYKQILQLHRGLPIEMRAMGDQYVKDEFKKHKTVNETEVDQFINGWKNYVHIMSKQLVKRSKLQQYGKNLEEDIIETLDGEKLGQLHLLKQEASLPIDQDNRVGEMTEAWPPIPDNPKSFS